MVLESAKRESKRLDFKERFDPSSTRECCEIIKDIIAMANSGGGVILIGVRDNGQPSGFDVEPILTFDPAKLTDKIASFTGEQFCEFEFQEIIRDGQKMAAIQVSAAGFPIIFCEAGTYIDKNNNPKSAFAKGTLYFRHGAKSEPGNSQDLRQVLERKLDKRRKGWLGGIRKVVEAPAGAHIQVIPPNAKEMGYPVAMPVRLVTDSSAPAYRKLDPDTTHPFRQKELLEFVNRQVGNLRRLNTHDILCARKALDVDNQPDYFHRPKFGSPQYSVSFAEKLVALYQQDAGFFDRLREQCKAS